MLFHMEMQNKMIILVNIFNFHLLTNNYLNLGFQYGQTVTIFNFFCTKCVPFTTVLIL